MKTSYKQTVFAYPEEFVDSARNVLGEAFDWVANTCDDDLTQFASNLAKSPVGTLFEQGSPKYTMGVNGAELANAVMESLGLAAYQQEPEFWLDKSAEYWVGYMLALYQWERNIPFRTILAKISIEELLGLYALGHEQDEEKIIGIMDEWMSRSK